MRLGRGRPCEETQRLGYVCRPQTPCRCRRAGTLYRTYPNDWQVLKWDANGPRVVHSQKEMPSLKEVALEILPRTR